MLFVFLFRKKAKFILIVTKYASHWEDKHAFCKCRKQMQVSLTTLQADKQLSFHCLDSIIFLISFTIWSLLLASVTELPGLCLPWSQTQRQIFFGMQLIIIRLIKLTDSMYTFLFHGYHAHFSVTGIPCTLFHFLR